MIRKFVAITLAVLINCAVLAWFQTWSTALATHARSDPARVDAIPTLPTITVHPTSAEMSLLRRDRQPVMTSGATQAGDTGIRTLVMPYYSFADESDVASSG